MTYATVMVSLALDQPNEARLEAAGQIAERFDAGIVGIAASQFSPPLYFTSGKLAQDLIDEGRASINKRIGELEGQFREAVKKRAKQVEWRSAIDFPGTLHPAGSALRRHHRQRWQTGGRFRTRWRWPARRIS